MLEEERTALEREKVVILARHKAEADHLRESRRYEVTHERVRVMAAMMAKTERRFNNIRQREAHRDEYDTARCLHSQAFGTRRCLEKLKETGKDIPQETIDVFAAQEKHYEQKVSGLDVGDIP